MLEQEGEKMRDLESWLKLYTCGRMSANTHQYAAKTLIEMYACEPKPQFLESGLSHVEKAIALFPQNPASYVLRAELLLLKADVRGAQEAMDVATTMGAAILAGDHIGGKEAVFGINVRRVKKLLDKAVVQQPSAMELVDKYIATDDVRHLTAAIALAARGKDKHAQLATVFSCLAAHHSKLSQ
jgi:hypothetical protein